MVGSSQPVSILIPPTTLNAPSSTSHLYTIDMDAFSIYEPETAPSDFEKGNSYTGFCTIA